MRLSPSYYPETVDHFYCENCDSDNYGVPVDSIEADDVRVYCPLCFKATYVRVIE